MADYTQFKKGIEDWARPDRRATLIVAQDGEAHALVTVMGAALRSLTRAALRHARLDSRSLIESVRALPESRRIFPLRLE
jgi:hypothetical protein